MALPDFDCYAVLEVDRNARRTVIAAAYRVLVKEYHPDRDPAVDPRRIKRINVAYEVLTDPERREAYDALLKESEAETAPRGRTSSRPTGRRAQGKRAAGPGTLVCRRCGQRFKTQRGLDWHNTNRPRCNLGG